MPASLPRVGLAESMTAETKKSLLASARTFRHLVRPKKLLEAARDGTDGPSPDPVIVGGQLTGTHAF